MAQVIDLQRHDMAQRHRDDVEQAAIQIEIVELKQGAVGEAAFVIIEDQLTVMMLHPLVVGDGVDAEGHHHEDEQCCEQRQRGEIEAGQVDARQRRLGVRRFIGSPQQHTITLLPVPFENGHQCTQADKGIPGRSAIRRPQPITAREP